MKPPRLAQVSVSFRIPAKRMHNEQPGTTVVSFVENELQQTGFVFDLDATVKILHEDPDQKKDALIIIDGTIPEDRIYELEKHERVVDVFRQ